MNLVLTANKRAASSLCRRNCLQSKEIFDLLDQLGNTTTARLKQAELTAACCPLVSVSWYETAAHRGSAESLRVSWRRGAVEDQSGSPLVLLC